MTSIPDQSLSTPVKLPFQPLHIHTSSINPEENLNQRSSSDSNSIQNSHPSQIELEPIQDDHSMPAQDQNHNELNESRHEGTPQGQAENNKPQSTEQKQTERKKRRKKLDSDGRDYTCSCGKSYLSYPALYTHVKTKHNGEISITQNLRIPLASSNPMTESRQNLHSYKKQSHIPKHQPDEDCQPIQKIKQFIYKQFIKDRTKDALIQFKSSLILKEKQKIYVNQILKVAEYGDNHVKVEEDRESSIQRQFSNSNSKSENPNLDGNGYREEAFEMFGTFGGSPQTKRFEKIHVIRTVMLDKNLKENSRPAPKTQKKGFISCIFPSIPETTKRSITKPEQSTIDEVLGHFLTEFLKGVASNQLINMSVLYFVCRIKEFYDKESKRVSTSEKEAESMIEDSGELVNQLIQMDNSFLKQPIVVCKFLFFFYRWMFKQQFTYKFVRFNQAG